jgi:Abortive infection alpha
MEDPTNAAVKATIESVLKPIEGIVKTIAGPAAEELGLVLRDKVREYRFQRQVRFFTTVKQLCVKAGIKPKAVNMPLLMDILDRASMEPNDDLQDLWANLLANAADPNCKGLITNAFPEILKQLSKDEATFLEDLYKCRKDRYLAEDFAVLVRARLNKEPVSVHDVYQDNLRRLGLTEDITIDDDPPVSAYSPIENPPLFPKIRQWKLTEFGIAFIEACTSPIELKKKL